MSMSVDGLVSGMDTTSIIAKLLQVEAAPQQALQTRLKDTQNNASAYQTVNTTFAAVRAAAEALTDPNLWTSAKATSTSGNVAASATGTKPPAGSLTFTVKTLAAAHSVVNQNSAWTSTTSAYGASSIEVKDKSGAVRGTVTVGGTGTLADAAAAINNDTTLGLSATMVQVRSGSSPLYSLQITSKTTGADSEFSLIGAGSSTTTTQASNAELQIGTTGTYSVYSSTNTFDSVMPGVTLTVNKADTATPVTVAVAQDPDTVANKVQALVDAVNSALTTVKTYTSSAQGSTAALKGDYAITSLAGQLVNAVTDAVGAFGSPAQMGLQLTGKDQVKDGKIVFDKSKFLDALKADPTLAKNMVGGTLASNGTDGIKGTSDDVKASGVAGRLQAVAKAASDSTTGSIVALAKGQDSIADDLKDRIDAWDLRLAARKEALTRQFTAMETALSSLKNQSTWLAGQINGLPHS